MVSAAKKLDRVRDRAPFQPVSPDLDINKLVLDCPNFCAVERVDARTITDETIEPLRQLIQAHVIEGGKPLVLENWHERSDWPRWIFNPDWLRQNHGTEPINVRDIPAQSDMLMTLKHYLNNLGVLASKFTLESFNGPQQRLYAKDIDCPSAWHQALEKVLPACTSYLSSADLMSSLPPEARAQNLMCYFGHEGTYTPAHKEMCASLGQNIMVYTSDGANPGSSIWFMTASGDRELVAEYWLGGLGHDIEVESHFASVDAFMEAPFPVYIVEQKLGDYILVPPLAPHQVWNRGEATMKVAWNRTTPETLELAIRESLPKSRLVCRDEQYKNKAIIYETLKNYSQALSAENDINDRRSDEGNSREKMKADFCKLFKLFNAILLDEEFSFDLAEDMNIEKIPNEFNVTCSFCRGNIFNRFLSCKNCIPPSDEGEEDDVYDVCLECYARGRSCGCISKLCWVEQHDWRTLVRDHDAFRQLVISIDGAITDESPLEFDTAFEYLGKKTLAWVCQEQLQCRPFVDITKDPYLEDMDDDKEIMRKKKLGLLINCHVCKVRHPGWKVAQCSSCTKAYCYGNLWRAFDIDPFDVLADHTWKCPVCLGICSCGQCRKNGKTRPYEPKGTMLGASTKHVADPRSVQSLVDFSRGNLGWLQPEHAESLKRKRASVSTEATDNGEGSSNSLHQSPLLGYRLPFGVHGSDDEEPEIPIDPSLENSEIPMRDHYIHANSPNSNPNTGNNSVGGNGQYTSDDSSVALVERGHVAWANASRQQVDGSASSLRAGVMEGLVDLVKTRGIPRTKQSLFPSPDAMLTGALPSGGRESPSDTHSFNIPQPDSYLSGVRSLSGKPQSKIPRGEFQPYRHQSFAQDINSDDQSLSRWPEMSSLEKDPAAFIAAAGLSILSTGTGFQNPHESSSESTVNCQPGAPSAWPIASAIPAITFEQNMSACDDDFGQNHPQHVAARPHILDRDPSGPDSREEVSFIFQEPPTASYENYRPSQLPLRVAITSAERKRKSTAPSGDIYTSASSIIGIGSDIAMTEPTKPMRDMIVSDWVKKQKLAKAKVANLKGRGKNRKSLVVVLNLGREGWNKWQEQKVEPDLVTKELILGGGKVHKVLVGRTGSGDTSGERSVSTTTTSTSVGEASGGSSGGPTRTFEPSARGRGRPKKIPKPEFMDVGQDDEQGDDGDDEPEVIPRLKARKRESAWMARKQEEEAKEEAANAIENEKRAREKAIEDQEKARLKFIEDEKRRMRAEKQRREDEKKAIEEGKRRKEEERLQEIKDEKYRKEAERRRAYQEAKRMAAKIAEGQSNGAWDYDSEEEYEQDYYQEEEEVEEVVEVVGKAWWESKLPGSSFAVAIQRRPGYYWKTQYITETELASRTDDLDKPNTPTPTLTTKTPAFKQPAANGRKIMEKSPTVVVVGDILPVTKPRRKSTAGVATAKMTSAQKSVVSDLDSDDARKWSIQKTKEPGAKAPRTNRLVETVKSGVRIRSAITKYSDPDETFEHDRDADWSINDGKEVGEMEVEAEVNAEGKNVETEEGYDDRWRPKGRKWMW